MKTKREEVQEILSPLFKRYTPKKSIFFSKYFFRKKSKDFINFFDDIKDL